MEKIKGYKIGLRTTVDIDDGRQLSEPCYAVYVEYDSGSLWYEIDVDTLEEAREYVSRKQMEEVVDKYKKLIEDEIFKATPDETIGFCEGLKCYLDELIGQSKYEKEQYK